MSAHPMPTHHNSMGNNLWTMTSSSYVEEEIVTGWEDVMTDSYMLPARRPVKEIVRTWTSVTSKPFVF